MKKLLFVPILGILAFLGSCSIPHFLPPTPSEMIKQAHDAFPKVVVPNFNPIKLPPQPKVKHAPKARPHLPQARPIPDQATVETLPPQEGLACIWPLSLIPGCHPQESGVYQP